MQKIEFKDYPDTSTLINAENLNTIQDNVEISINEVDNRNTELINEVDTALENLENNVNNIEDVINQIGTYIYATAGSNGDFYCTLTRTLSINDIVMISFPDPTVPSANARLSIDGGTTYINIVDFRDNVNILARTIWNKKEQLYYNGISWVLNVRPIQELLWGGSVTTGYLTLSRSCLNYSYLLIRQSSFGSLAMCPVLKNLTRITGITVFASVANQLEINAPRLTRSTDGLTLTIEAVGRMNFLTTPAISYIKTDPITEIWGVK